MVSDSCLVVDLPAPKNRFVGVLIVLCPEERLLLEDCGTSTEVLLLPSLRFTEDPFAVEASWVGVLADADLRV